MHTINFAQGIDLLVKHQSHWDTPKKVRMGPHIWWHMALFHIERGDHESALSLMDEKLTKVAQELKSSADGIGSACLLVMSDATSLLLRLQMEGTISPAYFLALFVPSCEYDLFLKVSPKG